MYLTVLDEESIQFVLVSRNQPGTHHNQVVLRIKLVVTDAASVMVVDSMCSTIVEVDSTVHTEVVLGFAVRKELRSIALIAIA